jgi:hypothetical protein
LKMLPARFPAHNGAARPDLGGCFLPIVT